eukprot:300168_1
MSINFEVAKRINPCTKNIVNGYIKRLEKKFLFDNTPNLVIILCIIYYHEDTIFNKHHEYMELSMDKKTVTMMRDYISCYCYSSNWISVEHGKRTTIHIKIDKIGSNFNNVVIGIATNDHSLDGMDCYVGDVYGFSGDRSMNRYLQSNDNLKIQICTKAIRFILNDQLVREISYFDIDVLYKIVLIMWSKGTQVTLLNVTDEYFHHSSYCIVL